jgi:arsenate reductase
MTTKRSVLFICTGNVARSQMAEALLRASAGDRFEVRSAGSRPGAAVNPLVVSAMREIGVDLSGTVPKGFDAVAGMRFDFVVTLCDSARDECPFFPGHPVAEHWSLEDPSRLAGTDEERLAGVRRIRDDIRRRIGEFVERVR